MTKIEIEIPDELEFVRRVPSINWTVLVSKMLKEKIREIEEIKRIVAKSQLTERDVEEISDEINKNASEHYK